MYYTDTNDMWQMLQHIADVTRIGGCNDIADAFQTKANRVRKAMKSVRKVEKSGRHAKALTKALENYINTSTTGFFVESEYRNDGHEIRVRIGKEEEHNEQDEVFVVDMKEREVVVYNQEQGWIPLGNLYRSGYPE